MEVAKRQVEYLGGSCSNETLRSVANAGRRALEALPITDAAFLEAKYNSAAEAVGLESPLPEALLGVKPSQIRSVCDYDDGWRLRPLFIATLLGARNNPNHPMWGAAKVNPSIGTAINEIAGIAGEAAHPGAAELTTVILDGLSRKVYEVVRLFLEIPIQTSVQTGAGNS